MLSTLEKQKNSSTKKNIKKLNLQVLGLKPLADTVEEASSKKIVENEPFIEDQQHEIGTIALSPITNKDADLVSAIQNQLCYNCNNWISSSKIYSIIIKKKFIFCIIYFHLVINIFNYFSVTPEYVEIFMLHAEALKHFIASRYPHAAIKKTRSVTFYI